MEQKPEHYEQADHTPEAGGDAMLIRQGITDALLEDRAIDHATARYIAEQLHGDNSPELRALASSGVVGKELATELEALRVAAPLEHEPWFDALEEYFEVRADPRPIEGWQHLWPTAILGRSPAEQVGSTEEMGWFGVFPCEDRSGGVIFTADSLGCRAYFGTASGEELVHAWSRIREEHRVPAGQSQWPGIDRAIHQIT